MKIFLTTLLLAAALAHGGDENWTLLSDKDGTAIYKSPEDALGVCSYRAVAILDAPIECLRNVLDDVEGSPDFMPYVAEVRVLKREGSSVTLYQRVNPPLIAERDCTLRLDRSTFPSGGTQSGYKFEWDLVKDIGPPEIKGVARATINSGSWMLEPAGENKTRVTYMLRTDVGSKLPEFIVSRGNRIAIPKLFRAVLDQAGEKKYRDKTK